MTEDDLKAIEARRKFAMNEFWPETPKRCQKSINQDIPALIAEVRRLREEVESRREWHGRMQDAFDEAIQKAERAEFTTGLPHPQYEPKS